MTKIPLFADDKAYLRARDADRLSLFLLDGGRVRGAYVQANLVVRELAANHHLGPYETLVLGQAAVAGLLMASNLKGDDRLNLVVKTNGPAGGFSIDADARGTVRGYLDRSPFEVPATWTAPTLGDLLGQGLLQVTRFTETGRAPVTGSVEYRPGDLALSLAHYFDQSEQVPTALILSLPFDREGGLVGAGGLILQALPGLPTADWEAVASRLYELPRIGDNAAESHDPAALLEFWFGDLSPQLLDSRRVEFFCPCSSQRFGTFLRGLPEEDRRAILTEGPLPLETTCHHCSSVYRFSRTDLEELWRT